MKYLANKCTASVVAYSDSLIIEGGRHFDCLTWIICWAAAIISFDTAFAPWVARGWHYKFVWWPAAAAPVRAVVIEYGTGYFLWKRHFITK